MFLTEYDSLKKKKKKKNFFFFSVSLYSVQNIAIHRIRLIFDSSNTLVYRLSPTYYTCVDSAVFTQRSVSNNSHHGVARDIAGTPLGSGHYGRHKFKNVLFMMVLFSQGRSVPYARTQVLPHRFDNLKKILNNFFFFFV